MHYLDELNIPRNLDNNTKKEINKHHLIRISSYDKILLFIHHNLPFFIKCAKFKCCSCLRWKNRDKMLKMYRDGIYKIEKDLNLVRLIKMLKRLNILMKNSLMTSKIEFEIAH